MIRASIHALTLLAGVYRTVLSLYVSSNSNYRLALSRSYRLRFSCTIWGSFLVWTISRIRPVNVYILSRLGLKVPSFSGLYLDHSVAILWRPELESSGAPLIFGSWYVSKCSEMRGFKTGGLEVFCELGKFAEREVNPWSNVAILDFSGVSAFRIELPMKVVRD